MTAAKWIAEAMWLFKKQQQKSADAGCRCRSRQSGRKQKALSPQPACTSLAGGYPFLQRAGKTKIVTKSVLEFCRFLLVKVFRQVIFAKRFC
jgi:hypothetical protein